MELFERKQQNCIEGIDFNTLEEILKYKNPNIRMESNIQKRIYLSDGTILKCINCYYKANGKTIKVDDSVNSCFKAQKFFDINCYNYDCRNCHLLALEKLKANNIEKI